MGWKFNSKWQVGLVLREEKYRLISLPKIKKQKKKNIYIYMYLQLGISSVDFPNNLRKFCVYNQNYKYFNNIGNLNVSQDLPLGIYLGWIL